MKAILQLIFFVVFTCTTSLVKAQLPPGPGTTDSCDIAGLYSIGPNGDFATLTVAVDSLTKRGIGGDVIFELNNQYLSSAEVFPITFPKTNRIKCYSYEYNFTVTIRPAPNAFNRRIIGTNPTAILNLDSCRYVRIDGRPGGIDTTNLLTITNNADAPAIALINSSNNRIVYTNISGGISNFGLLTGVIHLQGTKGIGSDSNIIFKCNIFSATTSPSSKSTLVYSTNTTGFQNNNDSLIGCNFYNFGKSAIQLENFAEAWVIQNNSFYSTTSIKYETEVTAIKINTASTTNTHLIDNNIFGGTQPLGKGNVMAIDYKNKFYWIDVAGNCTITNNKFVRQRFANTVNNVGNIDIRMINAADETNYSTIVITNNQFGSSIATDSLHFKQSFANNNVTVGGIVVNIGTAYKVFNNSFDNLRCYAVSNAAMELRPIYTFNGFANIKGNNIGNANNINSIINNTTGATYGIACLGATTRVNDNIICNINNNSLVGSGGVLGIYTNSGSLDSVSRNTIFELKNTIPTSATNGSYSPLGGISIGSPVGGGLGNVVSDNIIHSLQNKSNLNGGSVIAIATNRHIFIKRNLIYGITSTAENNTTIYGIFVIDKFSDLENNIISLGVDHLGNSITGSKITIIGVSGGHTMRHNTIYIGGTNVEEGFVGSMCYEFIGSALPTYCYNNIFYNARSNAQASFNTKHQCVNITLSYGCNNNLFYYTGNGAILGTYLNVRYNTLDNYKAGSGLEANSLFADPQLIKPAPAFFSAPDLHLNYGSPAEASGDGNYTTLGDFDKEYRNSLTPVDIGADAGNYGNCPVADAGYDVTFFEGGSAQLGSPVAIPNATYLWTPSQGIQSNIPNPNVSPDATTIYILQLSVGNCVSYDTVVVNVFPVFSSTYCPNETINLTANNISDSIYQWQVNDGNGYVNISNNATYTGANTFKLTINNAPSSLYGYKYRCLVNGRSDIVKLLRFENQWTGASNNLWNNMANWSCGIVPDGNTDVLILSGSVLLNTNGVCRSIYVAPNANFTVATGAILTITR